MRGSGSGRGGPHVGSGEGGENCVSVEGEGTM